MEVTHQGVTLLYVYPFWGPVDIHPRRRPRGRWTDKSHGPASISAALQPLPPLLGGGAQALFPDHEQRLVIEPEVLPMSLPDYPGLSAPGSGIRP